MNEILPCPFCGAKPYGFDDEDWDKPPYWVSCPNYSCIMNGVKTFPAKKQAIAAWNKRAPRAEL